MHPGKVKPTPTILISANSLFNIVNFRAGLVRGIAAEGFRPILVAPLDPAFEPLTTLNAETIAVRIDRSGINPLIDAALLLAYWQLCRRKRPAAYLGFTIKPNIYGALAARAAGVPSILNVSGLGTAFLSSGLFAWFISHLYRVAFNRAATVFFQNPDDRDLFLTRKIVRPEQVRLLPGSGIDLDRFRPIEVDPGAEPVFLFIGRLIADKGVREFVEAAGQVRQTHPGARFQLLGAIDPGNRTSVTPTELERWVRLGTVEHLGQMDDVRPAIAAASAVVLPSYREGLPRSLLEGGAMGRPLIATDVPGNRELVEEGLTGMSCRPRDASSLAEAVRRFLDLEAVGRRALGQAALERVRGRFGERKVIDAYLGALKPYRTSTG
ncbi:MAG: glycosyltransferase family 4 protein [Sphingomonas sp.]|uniref:glycosyltransferase family 4 protein n=1 Tax=Sphingomonas sp. TaxID=28214 RepID=UPI0017CAA0F6|nr:glycosyltransferase family 4 protein [Sphingomonas sp.]MBA3666247.1 glycosyltransferase family 4 protein [Sphingomonas sp.]